MLGEEKRQKKNKRDKHLFKAVQSRNYLSSTISDTTIHTQPNCLLLYCSPKHCYYSLPHPTNLKIMAGCNYSICALATTLHWPGSLHNSSRTTNQLPLRYAFRASDKNYLNQGHPNSKSNMNLWQEVTPIYSINVKKKNEVKHCKIPLNIKLVC